MILDIMDVGNLLERRKVSGWAGYTSTGDNDKAFCMVRMDMYVRMLTPSSKNVDFFTILNLKRARASAFPSRRVLVAFLVSPTLVQIVLSYFGSFASASANGDPISW